MQRLEISATTEVVRIPTLTSGTGMMVLLKIPLHRAGAEVLQLPKLNPNVLQEVVVAGADLEAREVHQEVLQLKENPQQKDSEDWRTTTCLNEEEQENNILNR